jgi:hypothetical protein
MTLLLNTYNSFALLAEDSDSDNEKIQKPVPKNRTQNSVSSTAKLAIETGENFSSINVRYSRTFSGRKVSSPSNNLRSPTRPVRSPSTRDALRILAEMGNKEAQSDYAAMCAEGRGGPIDVLAAVKYAKLAVSKTN